MTHLLDALRLSAREVRLLERAGVLVVLGARLLVRRAFTGGLVSALAHLEVLREEKRELVLQRGFGERSGHGLFSVIPDQERILQGEKERRR